MVIRRLHEEFAKEILRIEEPFDIRGDALELLARHHGLPSPLMDWTESPYIAAYFAYASARTSEEFVSVWTLDRSSPAVADPGIRIIEDPDLLRFNARALRQRGVFLRAERDTRHQPIEEQIAPAVFKFNLRIEDRALALADLDEMQINATTLFGDFDGAARTATARLFAEVTTT